MSSLVADTATNDNVKAAAIQNEKEILEKLTDAQKSKIPELKAKLSKEQLTRWPVAGQDMTLYRFLEARAFDVETAAEMLLNHLEWRKETYPIKKEDAIKMAKKWKPYRSVATWYFWRSLDPIPVEY